MLLPTSIVSHDGMESLDAAGIADSGASLSFVNLHMVRDCADLGVFPERVPEGVPCEFETGSGWTKASACIRLTLILPHLGRVTHWFLILPRMAPAMILGLDFGEQHDLRLNLRRREIQVGPDPTKIIPCVPSSSPGVAFVTSARTLPPWSETLVEVQCPYRDRNGVLLTAPKTGHLPIAVQAGMWNPAKEFQALAITNFSDKPVLIPALTPIAHATSGSLVISKPSRDAPPSSTPTAPISSATPSLGDAMPTPPSVQMGFDDPLLPALDAEFVELPPVYDRNTTPLNLGPRLTEQERDKIRDLCERFPRLISADGRLRSQTTAATHKIEVTGKPCALPPRRLAPAMRDAARAEVQRMLDLEVISPSSSPWSSPVVLVKKPDGSIRFCVDYRQVNARTVHDTYPLPRVDDALDALQGARLFSTMDCLTGFWQVPVDPASKPVTAFATPDGKYEFNRLPFGLINAPATFARMMDVVLGGLKWHSCLLYLDDIIVFGRNAEEHLQRLEAVFRALDDASLVLKLSKCYFGFHELHYLGHVVSADGISPNPNKTAAIREMPYPAGVRDVESFLGMANFYRKFVHHFSSRTAPLQALKKKDVPFAWTAEAQAAWDDIRDALSTAPILVYPDHDHRFEIHCDASRVGLGAVLMQNGRAIAYASWSLDKHQRNYGISELECLAVIWACEHFRPYVDGVEFDIFTDHQALIDLTRLDNPTGRLARWIFRLSLFHYKVTHRPGKLHPVPDALSRLPRPGAFPVSPSPRLLSAREQFLAGLSPAERTEFPLLDLSLTEEERTARARALQALLPPDVYLIERVVAERVVKGATQYLVKWIDYPEEENTWQPARGVPSLLIKLFHAETAVPDEETPRFSPFNDPDLRTPLKDPVELSFAPSGENLHPSWLAEIRRHLPTDSLFAPLVSVLSGNPRQISVRSGDHGSDLEVNADVLSPIQYALLPHLRLQDHLLWWYPSATYTTRAEEGRLVIPERLRVPLISAYHEGPFRSHLGRAKTVGVLSNRFWWPGLHETTNAFVNRCLRCQQRKSPRQKQRGLLSPARTSRPWEVIFFDFMGPFPRSTSGNCYVVTAIDGFTKYVLALAVPAANQDAALTLLRRVICFGGVPRQIRTDQGSHFTGNSYESFCADLKLPHITVAPYHHAATGQVERLHATLEDMIATSLTTPTLRGAPRQWDSLLDCHVFAYNTSVQKSVGDSPFFLNFGRDAMLPPDIYLLADDPIGSMSLHGYRAEMLRAQEVAHEDALDCLTAARQKYQTAFDATRRPADFRVGDLVLLHHPHRGPGAKLASPWVGPFRVLETLGLSLLRLSPQDNPTRRGVVHVSRVKHYHTDIHRTRDEEDASPHSP
jgi:transposase InsO family protein